MHAEAIEPDVSERGWFSRLKYPVVLVQTFRPCDWTDLHNYICEGERFSAILKERMAWLTEAKIPHNLRYESVEQDIEQTKPRVYRLFVEFTNTADSLVYRLRWSDGTVERIQP
jgi:hypothetical protein